MALADRVEALRSLLSQEGWATVLVLAGGSLLVAPPARGGLFLLGWLVGAVGISVAVVVVGARVWPVLRG